MDLQDEYKLSYLLVAHDLAVVEHISHRIAVMYLGRIVEMTDKTTLFAMPLHPYTEALLSAVPIPKASARRRQRVILKGDVPSPINPPAGCHFHTRCPYVHARCRAEAPPLREVVPQHWAACHLHDVGPSTPGNTNGCRLTQRSVRPVRHRRLQKSQQADGGKPMHSTRRAFMARRRSFGHCRRRAGAFAQWRMNDRYPDPAVELLDRASASIAARQRRAARHRLALVRGPGLVPRRRLPAVERHPEQPHHALAGGDGHVSVFRQPSNNSNGNTRDREGPPRSPASTTRAASRAPSMTARSPC